MPGVHAHSKCAHVVQMHYVGKGAAYQLQTNCRTQVCAQSFSPSLPSPHSSAFKPLHGQSKHTGAHTDGHSNTNRNRLMGLDSSTASMGRARQQGVQCHARRCARHLRRAEHAKLHVLQGSAAASGSNIIRRVCMCCAKPGCMCETHLQVGPQKEYGCRQHTSAGSSPWNSVSLEPSSDAGQRQALNMSHGHGSCTAEQGNMAGQSTSNSSSTGR